MRSRALLCRMVVWPLPRITLTCALHVRPCHVPQVVREPGLRALYALPRALPCLLCRRRWRWPMVNVTE